LDSLLDELDLDAYDWEIIEDQAEEDISVLERRKDRPKAKVKNADVFNPVVDVLSVARTPCPNLKVKTHLREQCPVIDVMGWLFPSRRIQFKITGFFYLGNAPERWSALVRYRQ
jgi:hypothetical protein